MKVAVVDLGFIGLANAISQGELPASTTSIDFSGTGIEADTSHGTAVAEHVADMAPGAQIYCIKVDDEVDLQNAANYIRNNGIDIANSTGTYNFTGAANVISNLANGTDGVQITQAAGTVALQNFTIGPVSAGQFGITVDTNAGGALALTLSNNSVDLNNAGGTGYAVTADGAGNDITFSNSNGAANDNVTINDGAGNPTDFQELNTGMIMGTVRINGMDLMP